MNNHFKTAKAQAARAFLNDFDGYTAGLYYTVSAQKEAADYLRSRVEDIMVADAITFGVLPAFPCPYGEIGGAPGIDGTRAEVEHLTQSLHRLFTQPTLQGAHLRTDLLGLLALHLLAARAADVMRDQEKNHFYGLGDEDALDAEDTPMIFRQFGEFLDHSQRGGELDALGLTISDVIAPDDDDAPETSSVSPWSGSLRFGKGGPTRAPTYAGHWVCEFSNWVRVKGLRAADFPALDVVTTATRAAWQKRLDEAPETMTPVMLTPVMLTAVMNGKDSTIGYFMCNDPRHLADCDTTAVLWSEFLSHPERRAAWEAWLQSQEARSNSDLEAI